MCVLNTFRGALCSRVSHLLLFVAAEQGGVSQNVSLWMLYHDKQAASLCFEWVIRENN